MTGLLVSNDPTRYASDITGFLCKKSDIIDMNIEHRNTIKTKTLSSTIERHQKGNLRK